MCGHLTGNANQWNGVHHRVGKRGHHVGRSGTGGHEDDTGLAGGSRIAFRGVAGSLLVPHQDVFDFLLLENLVVDREYRRRRDIRKYAPRPGRPGARRTISPPVMCSGILLLPSGQPCRRTVWPVPPFKPELDVRAIKKGPDGTLKRAPPFAAILADRPGDAPTYDKNCSHHAPLLRLHCRDVKTKITARALQIRPTADVLTSHRLPARTKAYSRHQQEIRNYASISVRARCAATPHPPLAAAFEGMPQSLRCRHR